MNSCECREFNNFNSLDRVELGVLLPAVVACEHTHGSMYVVAARSRVVRLLRHHFLFLLREPNKELENANLRNLRTIVRESLVVIMARSREHMRVRIEVLPNVGADPVRDILLVHGILICLVGARARNVFSRRFVVWLDAIVELGFFVVSELILLLGQWVPEIEITRNSVLVWSGRHHRLQIVATTCAEVSGLSVFLRAHRRISLGTEPVPVLAL